MNHPVFANKFDDFKILDYILPTLKLLHRNTKQALGLTSAELLDQCLSSVTVPDLTTRQRKLLPEEVPLSKELLDFILALPDEVRPKVRGHPEIVKLSDIMLTLHSRPKTFKLIQDYLVLPANKALLKDNGTIKNAAYVLMKNNKDAFETKDLTSEGRDQGLSALGKSTMLTQSIIPNKSLQTSNISTMQGKQDPRGSSNTESILQKNIGEFNSAMQHLLDDESLRDIFEEYIKALGKFDTKKP